MPKELRERFGLGRAVELIATRAGVLLCLAILSAVAYAVWGMLISRSGVEHIRF